MSEGVEEEGWVSENLTRRKRVVDEFDRDGSRVYKSILVLSMYEHDKMSVFRLDVNVYKKRVLRTRFD